MNFRLTALAVAALLCTGPAGAFDKSEAQDRAASSKESSEQLSDQHYIELCGQNIKFKVSNPSSFSFSRFWDSSVYRTDRGRVIVEICFEAKNAFNRKVAMQATCYFDGSALKSVELEEKYPPL